MFRFTLRTLLILLAVGPPLLGILWAVRGSLLSALVDIVLLAGLLTIGAMLLAYFAMVVLWALRYYHR